MDILIVNDDGIASEGLKALVEAFKVKHKVTVVAPQKQMSGMSRSVTIHKGLEHYENSTLGVTAFAIDGTPVDCVKFASLVLDLQPDLVLSGINQGENVGCDLWYSGTVGAAFEGAFLNVPSIAVSCLCEYDGQKLPFDYIAGYLEKNLDKFLKCAKPGSVINANFPNVAESQIKGLKVTPQGLYDIWQFYISDGSGSYRLNGGQHEFLSKQKDSDTKLLFGGYITVTPLVLDVTDHGRLAEVEEILK